MSMTNQEKFKVLADQIKIADHLDSEILAQSELTRVDAVSYTHLTLPTTPYV